MTDKPTPTPCEHPMGKLRSNPMTDKPTPMVPTDDEIEAVVQACRERGLRELDVFRTVVVKFGTPTLVGREPVAVVVPCYTPSGKRVALCSAKQDLPIGTKLYAAPQHSPTAQAADPDGEAFRTAARLGLTLRFYGGCAQSSMPGTPIAYEVVTGSDRAAAMREAVERAGAVIASGGESQRLGGAAQAEESVPAISDLPPLPDPDLRDVGTKPQDVKDFLNGYATEYARLALAARAPAESVPAPAGATPAEAVERIVHLRAYRERRIYVAGPMTGLPEYNFHLFNSTAERLRSEGWHVENPAEHGHVEGAGWADYLRWGISRIATCGAIYLLPGWSNSKGATLEAHIAGVLGLEVLLADGAEAPTPQQLVPEPGKSRYGLLQAIEVAPGIWRVRHPQQVGHSITLPSPDCDAACEKALEWFDSLASEFGGAFSVPPGSTAPHPVASAADTEVAPKDWRELAAKVMDALADAQEQTNATYPEHVKCYPSWVSHARWLRWHADMFRTGKPVGNGAGRPAVLAALAAKGGHK